jgi:hypothetical protein
MTKEEKIDAILGQEMVKENYASLMGLMKNESMENGRVIDQFRENDELWSVLDEALYFDNIKSILASMYDKHYTEEEIGYFYSQAFNPIVNQIDKKVVDFQIDLSKMLQDHVDSTIESLISKKGEQDDD